MKLDKIVEGKHNGKKFRFENGFLSVFSHTWNRKDIQTLVEIANLLQLEGYGLKVPIGEKEIIKTSILGSSYTKIVDTYEED